MDGEVRATQDSGGRGYLEIYENGELVTVVAAAEVAAINQSETNPAEVQLVLKSGDGKASWYRASTSVRAAYAALQTARVFARADAKEAGTAVHVIDGGRVQRTT